MYVVLVDWCGALDRNNSVKWVWFVECWEMTHGDKLLLYL